MFYDLVYWLSQAFYVLFVIDIVGLEQLGILLAISVLLQVEPERAFLCQRFYSAVNDHFVFGRIHSPLKLF